MKLVFLLFILFNQSVFAWSLFGYSSYSECMKEEIKDNDGKENSFIRNYCRGEFPIKTTPYEPLTKKWDKFNPIESREDYDIKWNTNGQVTVTNLTKSKTIRMVRIYFFYSNKCRDSDIVVQKDNYSYKEINVGPGQKKNYYFFITGEEPNCATFNVRIS